MVSLKHYDRRKKHADKVCCKELAWENMKVFTEIPAPHGKIVRFRYYTWFFLHHLCLKS